MVVVTDPGLRCHPSQLITTFLAKISPKPSMTPFTKGNSRFTAREETKAIDRARLESDESKIAEVSDTGAGSGATRHSWGGMSTCSGNDIEGKDDVCEGRSSHFSVAVSDRESGLAATGAPCVDKVVGWLESGTMFEDVVSANVILLDSSAR